MSSFTTTLPYHLLARLSINCRVARRYALSTSSLSWSPPPSPPPIMLIFPGQRTTRMASIRRSSCTWSSSESSSSQFSISELLNELRTIDTSSLCDADKILLAATTTTNGGDDGEKDDDDEKVQDVAVPVYTGLKLMDPHRIRPMNHLNHFHKNYHQQSSQMTSSMAGIIRTVQFTQPNDFLPVLRGLMESQHDEVLVVDTMSSTKAVAGEIFATAASRQGLAGMIVDGPIRDVTNLMNVMTTTTSPSAHIDNNYNVYCYEDYTPVTYLCFICYTLFRNDPIRRSDASRADVMWWD
jgi:Aldolase/RraA